MDTITHVLVGAVTARATAPDRVTSEQLSNKDRMIAGGIAAAYPDSDYITLLIDPLSFIADWHRSETHSLLLLPIWSVLIGIVLANMTRRRTYWRELSLVCGLSLCSHILTDLITSWGIKLFAPFSDFSPALAVTYVIDPVFTLIMFITLVLVIYRQTRRTARIGLLVLAAYIGVQFGLKHHAENIAVAYIERQALEPAEVFAMPQPGSPFHWKLIVSNSKQHHMAHVDLISSNNNDTPGKSNARLRDLWNAYQSPNNLTWYKYEVVSQDPAINAAWMHSDLDRYRRFARYPVVYRMDQSEHGRCIWFMDLRFTLPGFTPPFRYGICQYDTHGWQVYRLKDFTGKETEKVE
jgi:inner membrane protein